MRIHNNTAEGVVVTKWLPELYPHWGNMVSIRIKVSPNRDRIVDINPVSYSIIIINITNLTLRDTSAGYSLM